MFSDSPSANYSIIYETFSDTITADDGFEQLNTMGGEGALDNLNSLYFGISAFKFQMEGTRLFILDNTNRTDYR